MEDYREYFPIVDEKIFLNHAATSPLPLPTLNAMKDVLDKRRYAMYKIDVSSIFDKARELVAKFINCSSGEIAFLQNTSQALNIVANGLRLNSNNTIVTDDIEFPSVSYPWLNRGDVEVKFVKNSDGMIPLNRLLDEVDLNTRVIAISHVIYSSGYRFDLKRLRKLIGNKIILCIDAIQSLGAIPIDVRDIGIDVLASAAYKWLLGPIGISILYINRRLFEEIKPTIVGWFSSRNIEEASFNPLEIKYATDARRYMSGNISPIPLIGLLKSLEFIMEIGINNIAESIRKITTHLIDRLSEFKNIRIYTPREWSMRAGIISFKIIDKNNEKIVEKLAEKNIIVSHRMFGIRVSPHFYNTIDEIDKFVKELEKHI